jgi:cytochrome c oxidase cbb3-type subunit I
MLAGLLVSLQLIRHNPFAGIELFSRPLANGPHQRSGLRISGQRISGMSALGDSSPDTAAGSGSPLSWFIFAAWQFVVGATAVGILLGEAQGLEWGETPVWIDPLAQVGLLLVAINFMTRSLA